MEGADGPVFKRLQSVFEPSTRYTLYPPFTVYSSHTAYGIHKGCMHAPWPFRREVFSRADRFDDAFGNYIATD